MTTDSATYDINKFQGFLVEIKPIIPADWPILGPLVSNFPVELTLINGDVHGLTGMIAPDKILRSALRPVKNKTVKKYGNRGNRGTQYLFIPRNRGTQ